MKNLADILSGVFEQFFRSPALYSSGVVKFMAGGEGGAEQIVARIACNEIDLVLFFRDPISNPKHNQIEANLLRLCDSQNIPIATNIATVEVLIHGLERGDLEWRNIVNPTNSEDYV